MADARYIELLRLEHRHNDGSWGRLDPEPSHHSAAQHDPERRWSKGRIFRCASFDEPVRVEVAPGADDEHR